MLKFKVYQDKKKEYRWTLVASNGNIVADSGEGYKRAAACKKAIDKLIVKLSLGKFKIVEA